MKTTLQISLLFCILFGVARFARADFTSDLKTATDAVTHVLTQANALILDGRLDDATSKILSVFPEKSRSAVEAFVLGNAMFTLDPKISYALHKRAVHDLPDEPQVQFKWAMEQHRAGEYAGAAASYAAFSKSNRQYGPAYGLCAECLLRIGKPDEAAAAWQKSTHVKQVTLNELEMSIWAVNSHQFPDRERADLLVKAGGGDIRAAENLIYLDCAFEFDWWKKTINRPYLRRDLKVLRKTKFADTARLGEVLCTGDCAMKFDDEGAAIGELLRKQDYFVGDNPKLPQSDKMLPIILGKAILANVVSVGYAQTKLGPLILDRAKIAGDVETYRIAVALCADSEQLPKIEQMAWAATGDVEFAASLLARQHKLGKLKFDDPLLTAASQKCPEDATVAGFVLDLTMRAKQRDSAETVSALEGAIKAEYSHLSDVRLPITAIPRPSLHRLADDFDLLHVVEGRLKRHARP